MTDWFTSDTHFGHKNIIHYCARPFRDVEEMNRALIERWNARVRPDDKVFHLGDFGFKSREQNAEILRALNGYKVLVLGNHDRSAETMREIGFNEVHESLAYTDPLRGRVLLQHHPLVAEPPSYAMLPLPSEYQRAFVGHVHEKWAARVVEGKLVVNVGVDQHDYRPIDFAEALLRRHRPSVAAGKLLRCRVCPKTIMLAEFFIDGCPKCGARETEPYVKDR